jgi:hypothetical protein
MEEGVPGELAPADLGEEASDGPRRHRGVPHLERAELSQRSRGDSIEVAPPAGSSRARS